LYHLQEEDVVDRFVESHLKVVVVWKARLEEGIARR